MKSKKFTIGYLCAVLLLLLLATSVRAQDKLVVHVMMHNHAPRIPMDEDNIARFEADNPDIDVDLNIVASDFDTVLNTALASGEGPDVFNQWTAFMGQFYQSGLLAPVDPIAFGMGSNEEITALYGEAGSAFLAGATFDGTLYGIPTELSIYACYANNEMFRAAGLDPEKDFPATWEDMKDVAEKLTIRDADGVPTQRGYDFNWSNPIYIYLTFEPMVRQLGGKMIDEETLTANLNTPEVQQVMQYWIDWANTWKLGGPQYTPSIQAFLNKEQAIECTMGNWGVPGIEDAGIDWSLHPVPRWANAVNDNGFAMYAYFLMVNAYSPPEVQEAGWKLISYLTSTPDRALKEAGLFQPRVDFTDTDAFKSDPVMPLFLEEMSKSFFTPLIPGFTESGNILGSARDRILNGEDMTSVLTETETEVDNIIANAGG